MASLRNIAAPYWAEFVGTLVLTVVGLGSAAQALTSDSSSALSSSLAWGLAVALGIWTSEHVSGGHINPSVTLAKAVFQGFSWAKVVGYIASQTLGAFAGAFLVWWNYAGPLGGIKRGEGAHPAAGAFITANDVWPGLLTEITATFVFVLAIFAVTDQSSNSKNIGPLAVGLSLTGVSLALSSPLNLAVNPARDFGPRVFAAFAYGWGDVFADNGFYFWVPIAGPVVGGLLGGFVYEWLVKRDAEYQHQLEEGTA